MLAVQTGGSTIRRELGHVEDAKVVLGWIILGGGGASGSW